MEVWKMKDVRCMFLRIGMCIMVVIVSGCDQLLNDADSEGEKDGGLKFPTGSTTGTIYPLGAAMTDLWENELDDVQVSVQASNGGIDNLNLLKDGEGDISFAVTSIVSEAYNGERSLDRKSTRLNSSHVSIS